MVREFFIRFRKDETGAAMVEYAVALLVVTGIGVTLMNTLSTEAKNNVEDACDVLAGAADSC